MVLRSLIVRIHRNAWRMLRVELGIVGWSLVTCALLVLGGVAHMFWAEWRVTQAAVAHAEFSRPRGFIGIGAGAVRWPPDDFVRQSEEKTYLWANPFRSRHPWYDVTGCILPVGHFNFELGPYDGIEAPIRVDNDHAIARRLANQDVVVGVSIENQSCAFPDLIMRRVVVVNDRLGGQDFVLLYLPPKMGDTVAVYRRDVIEPAPLLEVTGYTYAYQPVLFDQQTGSLWHPAFGKEELIAVAGPLKGSRLPLLTTPEKTTWKRWYRDHRNTQVLIGADRGAPTGTSYVGRHPVTPTVAANVFARPR